MAHLGHLGYLLADHRMICFGSNSCTAFARLGGQRQKTKVGHQMDSTSPSQNVHPLLPLQYPPAPPPLRPNPNNWWDIPAPPTISPPALAAPAASTLPPWGLTPAPSATKPTHRPGAPLPTNSTTDPTPITPHPTQMASVGPPAGGSRPEIGGQPHAAGYDKAENPPERPVKPEAPTTKQAERSSRGSAGSQGASGKRQSPKARGSRGHGTKEGKGGDGGSGHSQPAVPPGLRGLRAAAAVVPARRAAQEPQRLRMPHGVTPNA